MRFSRAMLILTRRSSTTAGAGAMDLASMGRFGELLQVLRRRRFDLTVDLQGLLRSGVMTAATRRGSRRLRRRTRGRGLVYTHRFEAPRLAVHAVDRVLRLAQALVGELPPPRFEVPIAEDDRLWRSGLE